MSPCRASTVAVFCLLLGVRDSRVCSRLSVQSDNFSLHVTMGVSDKGRAARPQSGQTAK